MIHVINEQILGGVMPSMLSPSETVHLVVGCSRTWPFLGVEEDQKVPLGLIACPCYAACDPERGGVDPSRSDRCCQRVVGVALVPRRCPDDLVGIRVPAKHPRLIHIWSNMS